MSEHRRRDRIVGTAMPVRGDDIDTDRIIPARFLKSVTFDGLEAHLFEDDRRETAGRGGTHPVDDPRFASATILLANANFGCGSSREHAPQAIYRRGIRAIAGQSFSEIFFGNSVALGMPCVTVAPEAAHHLIALAEQRPETAFTIDLREMVVTAGDLRFAITLPPAAREAFLDGSWDAMALLLENFEDVRGVASRLPYINGFR